jgi:uncharacterized Zn-binding protein involved in type VI secretion
MATGHFLCVADKTSCGGEILEGYAGWISNGRPRARAGDAVSCGVDGQVYAILGGVSFQILDGRPAAGTLDSVVIQRKLQLRLDAITCVRFGAAFLKAFAGPELGHGTGRIVTRLREYEAFCIQRYRTAGAWVLRSAEDHDL